MPGRHRKNKQPKDSRIYIIKYETTDGDTRTDGAEFTDKNLADDHAKDVENFPNIKKAWVE